MPSPQDFCPQAPPDLPDAFECGTDLDEDYHPIATASLQGRNADG
jgi:hypothetical protein